MFWKILLGVPCAAQGASSGPCNSRAAGKINLRQMRRLPSKHDLQEHPPKIQPRSLSSRLRRGRHCLLTRTSRPEPGSCIRCADNGCQADGVDVNFSRCAHARSSHQSHRDSHCDAMKAIVYCETARRSQTLLCPCVKPICQKGVQLNSSWKFRRKHAQEVVGLRCSKI